MIPHPLFLLIGFFTMMGFNQRVIQAESQQLSHTYSGATQFPVIVAITQAPTQAPQSLHPQPTPETQTLLTIVPTETPTPWTPNPSSDYGELIDFCNHSQVDNDQWRNALNQVAFPSDVTDEGLENLLGKTDIRPSCNFDLQNKPKAIVLHYTEGPLEATFATFQKPHNSSAHYVIDRDGKVYQVIPEQFAAYHVTCYGNRSLCIPSCPVCTNSAGMFIEPRTQTIGIELVNLGHVNPRYYTGDNNQLFEDYNNSFGYRFWEDYPQVQIHSLKTLVEDIQSRWNIPIDMVMGHSRINTNVDPGPALNLFWFRYGNPQQQAIFN